MEEESLQQKGEGGFTVIPPPPPPKGTLGLGPPPPPSSLSSTNNSSLPQPPVVASGWNDPPIIGPVNTIAGAKPKKVFRHVAPPPSILMGFTPPTQTVPSSGGGGIGLIPTVPIMVPSQQTHPDNHPYGGGPPLQQ